jgi:hypothetical protein
MPLYLVETINQFRNRYVVDCQSAEHADDTITCEEANEFSQMHLGETIVATREITLDEFHRMNKSLNGNGDGSRFRPENGSPWMGEKMIHKVNYEV